MQELSTKIDWLHIKISQILNELFPNNNAFDKPEGFLSLPLETEESFVNFDNHLNNKVLYGQMVSFFTIVNNSNIFIFIKYLNWLYVIAHVPVTKRKGRNDFYFYLFYFVNST